MRPTSSNLGAVLQDRYRLDSLLGTGASARVFLAYDLELHRHVAIKRLHPGLASDDNFLARFRSEARAVAALNHPHIVQIHDWGKDDDGAFLVLEYLAGGSLRVLLDRGVVLGVAEVAQIGAQAANALSFAHAKGIVHRDVKPANLLFDDAGSVHVADFGLARAMVDASWTEPIGVVFGTARYASPEQALGENVDDRSDVYSLALVCYEALVGAPPFQADTPVATLMARVGARLPNAAALGELAPALLAATADDPRLRLDARSLSSALASIAERLPAAHIPLQLEVPERSRARHDVHRDEETAVIDAAQTEEFTSPKALPLHAAPMGRPRRRRLWLAAAIGVVVVIVAATLVVRYDVYGHTVPSVAGLAKASATTRLRDEGLRIGPLTTRYSSSVAAGEVISQSVRAGSHVQNGTTVDLVVSRGHAPELLPKLVGLPTDAATRELEKDAFSVKRSRVYSETVAPNIVVGATPASGAAPYGSIVVLEISQGPHPRVIPDLSGMSTAQARSALESLRLIPKNTRAYSNDVARGDVISTEPAAGATGVAVGSTVSIVISRGPQLVAVPNVAGLSITDALATLQAAGLVVSEQIGPPFARTATTTDPAPGTMVAPNSSVTLYAA
jgi:serine/threonine-protein kinase